MKSILILNAQLINEGKITKTDVFIQNRRIKTIATDLSNQTADVIIDAQGKYLMAGVIDDQVHFREPGLTHKADIYHEAKAAVAGGTTTFMEMPNTVPQALTQELLEQKYQTASQRSGLQEPCRSGRLQACIILALPPECRLRHSEGC